MKRALILCSIFLAYAMPAAGMPQWVHFQVAPFRGLNTTIFVQVGFSTRPTGIKLRLLRVGINNDPDKEVRAYMVEKGHHPLGGRSLRDYNPSPKHLEIKTVEFLPLGVYRVEVSDNEGVKSSDPVDTRSFPLDLLRAEKDRVEKSFFSSVSALSYGPNEMDELLAGRRLAPISLLAPAGTVGAKNLRFHWKSGKASNPEYVLYIFDDREVIWSGWSRAPGIVSKEVSRRLVPGHNYYWVVGGSSSDSLLTCEGLQRFEVARRP